MLRWEHRVSTRDSSRQTFIQEFCVLFWFLCLHKDSFGIEIQAEDEDIMLKALSVLHAASLNIQHSTTRTSIK